MVLKEVFANCRMTAGKVEDGSSARELRSKPSRFGHSKTQLLEAGPKRPHMNLVPASHPWR